MIGALESADEDFYPNIRRLLVIGCVSPIGTCEVETKNSLTVNNGTG